MKQHMYRQENI